jgi:hypothetical protein
MTKLPQHGRWITKHHDEQITQFMSESLRVNCDLFLKEKLSTSYARKAPQWVKLFCGAGTQPHRSASDFISPLTFASSSLRGLYQ